MRTELRLLCAATVCCVAAACSSNGNPNIGGGQSPPATDTDFAIAYVKRVVPTNAAGATIQDDLRLRRPFSTKADLYLRDHASPSGVERNITARITGTALWDVKDVDVSADGTRLIFAMRGPLTANQKADAPPAWHLWEYKVATDTLTQITGTAADTSAASQDISPHYLPDGRIVFSSTRQPQNKEILLDEGVPQFESQTEDPGHPEPAFVLHVMGVDQNNNPDVHAITQISFNQSHDVDATVLQNGRLMWSRWNDTGGNDGIALYTANPDGTDTQLLYGAASHDTSTTNPSGAATCPAGLDCTVQFVQAREMQNGNVLALVRPFTDADLGGALQIIDTNTYVENNQALAADAGQTGPAQRDATQNDVRTQVDTSADIPVPSPGGRFNSAFPLWDGTNRVLVSWTACRLQNAAHVILACTSANLADPTLLPAPPLYSLWLFNPGDNTLKPIVQPVEGTLVTDVVSLQPRATPPTTLVDAPTGAQYLAPDINTGIIDIRSVYDWDGAPWKGVPGGSIAAVAQMNADQRPARFLRIEKAVSIPDKKTLDFDRNTAFGPDGDFMRQVLGYIPVEPDGSVRVKVPANVAFQLDVLDVYGRRIFPQHRAWLSVRPGEVLTCNGCHNPQPGTNGASGISHGRRDAFTAAYGGAASAAPFAGTTTGITPCAGATMAEALAGSCGSTSYDAPTPSVDVKFTDPWFGGGAGNAPVKYAYNDPGFTAPIPTTFGCETSWSSTCRITIDYPRNVHPLWLRDRTVKDIMGNVIANHTCTSCHSRANAMGVAQVPAGQLDLSDGASATNPLQQNAYRQLLFARDGLTLVGGTLQPIIVTTTDPVTGQPVQSTEQEPAALTAGDAHGSAFFTESDGITQRFGPGGTHYDTATAAGWLSSAELRLISEWVDIGAEYYNNPFDAPLAN